MFIVDNVLNKLSFIHAYGAQRVYKNHPGCLHPDTYPKHTGSHILVLQHHGVVRGTVVKAGRVVIDVLDLHDDETLAAATGGAPTAVPVVRGNHVEFVRDF